MKFIDYEKEFNINKKIINSCLKPNVKSIDPRKIYDNIGELSTIDKIRTELDGLKGIYGFFCKIDNKLYVGSSENLVKRFNEHIKNQKSNIKLQRAILKYGLNNFYYIVFEFYNLNDKVLLIDIETIYLSSFKIEYLYNFKLIARSMLGYKHTIETKQKMLNRYSKYQHPFLGKHHTMKAK
jgi:group I intron endonuclease